MFQLKPGELFSIVKVLEDHTDSTTYFVQSIVRNSTTDATLNTVNLTDNGSRRFSGTFTVPLDTTGVGVYINIVTSVYTDSGFTSRSINHGDESISYLVQERWDRVLGQGFGGSDVDYKKIKEIIEDEIKKTHPGKGTKVNLSGVERRVEGLEKGLEAIVIPEQVDLSKITSSLKDLREELDNSVGSLSRTIENIPKPIEPNLKPLMKEIEARSKIDEKELKGNLKTVLNLKGEIEGVLQASKDMIDKFFNKNIKDFQAGLISMDTRLKHIETELELKPKSKKIMRRAILRRV